MAFDPTKFGATPIQTTGSFDATKFGATVVKTPSPIPVTPSTNNAGNFFSDTNESIDKYLNTPAYNMGQENKSGIVGTLGKETANVAKSLLKFGKGTFDFLNPIENLNKVKQAVEAGVGYVKEGFDTAQSEKTAQELEAKAQASDIAHGKTSMTPVAKPTDFNTLIPHYGEAAAKVIAPPALGQAYQAGQNTAKNEGFFQGGVEAVRTGLQSIAEDPYQLAPAFLMLKGALEKPTGGEFVNEASGNVRPETYADTKVGNLIDKTISKTAQTVTKPVEYVSGKANEFASTLAKYGTAQATGLTPKSISTILDNPEKFLGKDYGSNYTREAIGKKVSEIIDQKIEDLSATGKEYQGIRKSGETVNIPKDTIKNVLDQYGVELNRNGNVKVTAESTPMSKTDINTLQEFIDTFGKKKELTSNAFLNARKALSNMAKYDATKTDASTAMSRSLRAAYDALGKDQLTNLANLDAKYAPETTLLKQIRKDYLNKDGTFKDNALSKIANLTNTGRETVLARLDQISPGIGKEIAILKAVEDIANTGGQKVGTYSRALTTGATYLTTGLPGAIVEAILTNPKVATQILAGFAKLKGVDISGLMKKIFNTDLKTPNIGLSIKDVSGEMPTTTKVKPTEIAPEFKGFKDLSTKIVEKLKGRDTVSKQFIEDLTNSGDVKQPERDLIRSVLSDFPDKVPVKEFANAVQTELLPLKISSTLKSDLPSQYENISLPDSERGNVANYDEKIYNSPIKTSGGDVHFSNFDSSMKGGYFAHTRVEDLAGKDFKYNSNAFDSQSAEKLAGSKIRRVIELQSDLFQKGNLEKEPMGSYKTVEEYNKDYPDQNFGKLDREQIQNMQKLEPYRNTWQERIIKEEVKQAAKDGKAKLQFPTGETAMKIEGLGDSSSWADAEHPSSPLSEVKVGQAIIRAENDLGPAEGAEQWVVTDVLGDGQFKAVPKNALEHINKRIEDVKGDQYKTEQANRALESYKETFDISGKVDQSNPIYKFYEKEVGKYLKNKFGAKTITDPQGVTWNEVPVKKAQAKLPIEAFVAAPLIVKGLGGIIKKEEKK